MNSTKVQNRLVYLFVFENFCIKNPGNTNVYKKYHMGDTEIEGIYKRLSQRRPEWGASDQKQEINNRQTVDEMVNAECNGGTQRLLIEQKIKRLAHKTGHGTYAKITI